MDMVRTIEYRRPMNSVAIVKAGETAGALNKEIKDAKEDLKEYTDRVKARIKDVEEKLDELLDCLRVKRWPPQMTKVREQYDKPVAGKKTVTVAETGELLEVCDMTEEEKESLFRDRSGAEEEPTDNVLDAEAMAGK